MYLYNIANYRIIHFTQSRRSKIIIFNLYKLSKLKKYKFDNNLVFKGTFDTEINI